MKRYKAINGNSAIYLSRTEQIEEYRKKGWVIYEVNEQGNERYIAGPGKLLSEPVEDGYVRMGRRRENE